MKTFEERYTAWIDGQLEGSALVAFEQELTRRAAVGDARSDKTDAARLRSLLQDHLQAPALTNPDFFNHQLFERIEAESPLSTRRSEASRDAVGRSLFAWGFLRLVGLGAFSLFAAAALYYGLVPRSNSGFGTSATRHPSVALQEKNMTGSQVAEIAPPASVGKGDRSTSPEILMVKRSPIEETPDIQTFVPDQPVNPTTATPLHYSKPNVNVLWLNGLDYLPTVPSANIAVPDANTTAPVPAPAAGTGP